MALFTGGSFFSLVRSIEAQRNPLLGRRKYIAYLPIALMNI